jgi:hypothetical protein
MDANDTAKAQLAPITPEQAEIILQADFKNILEKIKRGDPISAAQRKLVEAYRHGPAPEYADNQQKLAELLGFKNRKTIQRLSKLPDAPKPLDNGKYHVASWRQFAAKHSDVVDDDSEDSGAAVTSRGEQVTRNIALKNEKLAFAIQVSKKNYVPKATAKQVWTQLVNAAKSRSFAGVPRLVTLIRLAESADAANEIARQEMTDIWREMEKCEWFNPNKQ